jgi:hypothetical protein
MVEFTGEVLDEEEDRGYEERIKLSLTRLRIWETKRSAKTSEGWATIIVGVRMKQ